ncbi:Na+/H+ antiporter NhaC family protein [Salisediminibacterium selenitireducens]|uniref:Na+/H+ antiporter NhaC-like protein n=1 Tax=Bacillus selenitireducens (strain ATCC 700615 / DSM 15326 / MLS10) TaxID=439292 RepID=D6Y176_BACIE|nr:Na+/H+ antiporter NhaC family protein [Salisediminibacterium selenitireducens]ADH98680.1 Na+/H+ antiporter NhaC-like protein [[Bacillus] selenitireducens MLS10]
MDHGLLSLVPPVLALVMVMITRKVLPSLGVGIIVGALMINQTEEQFINAAISDILSIVTGIFYVDGGVNTWEFYIILFLFSLGIIAAMITMSGGSRAFGEWAQTKVKTRVGAQLTAGFLGILIFIDDYFNSLTVGNVSRPITDRHRVSRAKLAYNVDSTAAPICVVSPISSWGAYIITIIGGILVTHGVTEYGALQAFLIIAPMNFYALIAILLVFAVAWFKLDFGSMRTHERRAIETGEVLDHAKGPVPGESGQVEAVPDGKVRDLLIPILTLVVMTVLFMITTGIQGTEGSPSLLATFENTDVAAALLYGGLVGLVVTLILNATHRFSVRQYATGIWAGIQSMLPAVYILLFAWTIIEIIGELGTGEYLASLVDGSIPLGYLPAILFIIGGFMAFSTGTSWGTFGIMLPIAGDIAAATDISLLLPMMAAVLAGAIFGDHCSPISDTTILSSTGAGSHHIDHVMTQLPYALIAGLISTVLFLILGFTGSLMLSLVAGAFVFAAVVWGMKRLIRPLHTEAV